MKVLLILIDGMRPDAFTGCDHDAFTRLKEHSFYTLEAKTVFPSVTLPCHMSLFHSVEPVRHGILSNTYVPMARPVEGLCEALHKAKKNCAMFYTWEELKDLTRPASMLRTSFYSWHIMRERADDLAAKEAAAFLKEEKPDFCFLYLGDVDEVGHMKGWMSEEYMESLRHSLTRAMDVIESVGEEYLTILIADHGGHDRDHGKDIPEDMTIPMMIHHPSFTEHPIENASILDVAPTILSLLDVSAPEDWEGKILSLD